MASFDIGANRPVGAVQSSSVDPAAQAVAAMQTTPNPVAGASTAAPGTAPQVQTRLGIDAGTIPVDQTRVDEIRKAVQSGTYPLVPAKIGDAMVAAGLLLRKTS